MSSLENLFQGGENGLIGELTCRNIYRHSQVYAFIPPLCHLAYDIENHPIGLKAQLALTLRRRK
ncbi:hypothetical protein ACLK1T_29230 [Escherichia coli]